MRVLVTGSTGLLGRAIAEHLGRAGHDVVGLARGSGDVRADIGAPGLAEALSGLAPCEAIVHCAASRGRAAGDPEIERTNHTGTEQVLELARSWGSRRFVFLSGVTVIGRPGALPVTEEHPVDPPDEYLASKLLGERLVAEAGDGVDGVSLRVSAPVGPSMPRDRMLAVFVRQAVAGETLTVAGQGSRRQDYVDVRDVAGAVELALSRPTGPVLNVAAGRSVSNLELAQRCVALADSESTIAHAGEDPEEGVAWEISIERARAELGWEPKRDLDGVIRELAAAQRSAVEPSSSSPRL